jgi:hypothetical protein
MPPGLTPAGAKLWDELVAELADPALDEHAREVRYHALREMNAELVGIMLRVRGLGDAMP